MSEAKAQEREHSRSGRCLIERNAVNQHTSFQKIAMTVFLSRGLIETGNGREKENIAVAALLSSPCASPGR
jgi:hypothetical protein